MFKKFTGKAKGNRSNIHQDNETLTKMLPLIEALKQGKKLYAEKSVLDSEEISEA